MDERSGRIAQNTILLYFRMGITMVVSLYTSRVVLKALGEVDYGIFSVIGGVVALFGVVSASLTTAISRFITYELGRGDGERLRLIFSTAVWVLVLLAAVIILGAEIFATYFLNSYMVLPQERLATAHIVLQCSLVGFVINLITLPYSAAIVAHERVGVFALLAIFEVGAKLAIALIIATSQADRLVVYSILSVVAALLVRVGYGIYCRRNFYECRVELVFKEKIFKELLGFAGWNFIGASSAILRDQGGNVLLNLFCGPTVNAARAVANQLNNAVNGFVTNFMVALNPQIIKSYAQNEFDYMFRLAFNGVRFSFYLLFLISLPILLNTQYLLSIWLVDVPDYTAIFVRLVLILAMCESLAHPLVTIMVATGNIRNYQLLVGGIQSLNFPVSFLLLYWNFPPQVVLVTAIVISIICECARLFMLKRGVNLPVGTFIKSVILNIIPVVLCALIPPLVICGTESVDLIGFLLSLVISSISTLFSIFFVGCNRNERKYVYQRVMAIFRRRNNKIQIGSKSHDKNQ